METTRKKNAGTMSDWDDAWHNALASTASEEYYRELAFEIIDRRRASRARSIRLAAGLILYMAAGLAGAVLVAVAIAHAWPAFVAYQAAEQDRLDREQIGLETAYHEQALDSLLRSHPEDTGL